jgi:hypothetical protein
MGLSASEREMRLLDQSLALSLQGLAESGALNPAQQSAARAAVKSIVDRLTTSTKKLAELLKKKEKDIRQAIERCKQTIFPGTARIAITMFVSTRNPEKCTLNFQMVNWVIRSGTFSTTYE